MPIRITGMNSGLDTEALVSELVSAYRKKTDKYVKAQTKLTWKQDAWKSLSAKTYSFRSSLDQMRFSKNYQIKKTSVSNSTKVTVTAGNNAVNGSQSLNITSLAKAGYLTGAKLSKNGKAVSKNTTLATLGYTGTGKVNLNGKEIQLDGSMTINDALSRFSSAGVTASFDETNQRIYISSKKSGAASDFTLAAMDADGREALKQLGLYTESSSTTALYNQYNDIYEEYKAATGATDMTGIGTWLEAQVQQYNKSSALISEANGAQSYLQKAADYKKALDTINNSSYTAQQKELLEDGSKFVGADGRIYTRSATPDSNGKTYYTADGGSTPYYFDTRQETVQAKDENGNPKVDANGDPVMETKTIPVFKDAAGNTVTDASTADEYLKDQGIDAEKITEYRNALTTKAGFEAAVKAEEDADNKFLVDRAAALVADGMSQADADAQAQQELEESRRYTDETGATHNWRSLSYLKDQIDNHGMSATDIEDAQTKVSGEQERAQEFVEDHALLASYAREYANAVAAGAGSTPADIVAGLADDLKFAVESLTAGGGDYSEGAVRVDGQDATIYLNGAQYTSDSNTFNVNGLTITALATTTTEDAVNRSKDMSLSEAERKAAQAELDSSAITITTATDNQAIYDKIKDFLGEYNNLINLMTGSYNSEKTSEYEPLTDEEREAMTESQIEKWEEKGKSGILRRDGTLSALMSTLTTAMSKSYEINGKKYSLSSFGIKTLGILNAEKNEHNAYHIDGDMDDDSVSGNTDKLMTAIMENPDDVITFFQFLSDDISIDLGKKMTSTQMRTYGNFYNDKEMAKEYSDYTTTIAKWEKKVAEIEDSYYKKFAAMEKALATLQSQSSQLAGLLG